MIPDDDPANTAPRDCAFHSDPDLVRIARAHGLDTEAAEAVAAIDAILHRLRRSMQRRDFGRSLLATLAVDLEVAHLDVISAIGFDPDGKTPVNEVTVGTIAERLAIDPSRASRLVAEVVERGFAQRVASQADARRICLELTDKGRRFTQAIREAKWRMFSHSLAGWPGDDLVKFAQLLDRFSGWHADREGLLQSAAQVRGLLKDEPAA